MRDVRMVDVFSTTPFRGNALAVVHDADDLTDADMAAIARWTNLSETTFLCTPTRPDADYRVRIWTTGGEMPFAGHPTLGSAHAWREAGGVPRDADVVVQECAAGPVRVRRGSVLAFEAPPLVRSGRERADRHRVLSAVGLDAAEVLEMAWVDNGPGWVGVLLEDPEALLARRVDLGRLDGLKVGLAARWPEGVHPDGCGLEVRAFYADGRDASEDPVTGSLNAGLAQWLVPAGLMPPPYVAAQGGAVDRRGRVEVTVEPSGAVLVGAPPAPWSPAASAAVRLPAPAPPARRPLPLSRRGRALLLSQRSAVVQQGIPARATGWIMSSRTGTRQAREPRSCVTPSCARSLVEGRERRPVTTTPAPGVTRPGGPGPHASDHRPTRACSHPAP